MIIQFIVSMAATYSFALLYSAPKKDRIYAALTGAIGWVIYLGLKNAGMQVIVCGFISAFVLCIATRIFAVINRSPATVYLLPGIFPIVPGAGIYYTAYYFFMNNMTLFGLYAQETIKTALAISFGIIFAMAIPQKLFKIGVRRQKK